MWSILAVIIFVAGLLTKNELLIIASSGFAVAGELWAIFNQMRKEHSNNMSNGSSGRTGGK